jgi:1-deoxy-D-xylulose-5-phosphate synthase
VPRDGARLRELLHEVVRVDDGPTAIRFPKGALPADIEPLDQVGPVDILHRDADPDVLIVAYGPMAGLALETASRLTDHGVASTVVDPRWVLPIDGALATLAASHSLVVTIEDNGRHGGAGATLAGALRDRGIDTPVRIQSIPQQFLHQGKRAELMADIGLTAQDVARQVVESVAGLASLDHRPVVAD